MNDLKTKTAYIRNFIFGVEDSLVSTVGLISGIAVVGVDKSQLILTGIILVFVEAFSMGVGSLLSENSAEEYQGQKRVPLLETLRYAAVMFFSYVVSGLIVIIPYGVTSSKNALALSISISLVGLFILGVISAKLSHTSSIKKGLTMLTVGGTAILLGVTVGTLVNNM